MLLSLQVMDAILADPTLGKLVSNPSLSMGATNLNAHGIWEESTRPNLSKRIGDLVPAHANGTVLTINDKKLNAPLRMRLRYANVMQT